ncbi:ELMO/CED-12 family-domain-containing protein [Coniella lustricola]|uniref:ELMO/CED-12 family-domain-containing protein n=1 Tax=Coniella lustricola TaxID=2025994 RepID=A0A2T3ADK4_9PEZI|nr:ELMO/CED-12 family-domain-containing protein [Coniella lustricola]
MDQADVPALLSRLASDEDAARKMAVFKLQSSINDPAFADVFISSGGLVILRRLIMNTGGNTLAYSLQSLTRLLEVDMGWDIFEGYMASDLIERLVELIVTNPLVNILRGAMSILVALVSHLQSAPAGKHIATTVKAPGMFGFRALKPALAVHPQFFDHVISQLQSADHALCAASLMLINALIRDVVSKDDGTSNAKTSSSEDWSKVIKKLQDLGLIKAAYNLMQSSALQDLAQPLLDFQTLTKVLLRKWKEVKVDIERPEHRRALKGTHLASAPDRSFASNSGTSPTTSGEPGTKRHNPEKWRRLGFQTESPASDFHVAGFLGMMDLTDYVRRNEDGFQKMLLEQSTKPLDERCPIARSSLAVTMILFEHFGIDKADLEDTRGYQAIDNIKTNDKIFKPLLLQWSRLHVAGLHAFFRMWKATGAERDDFEKVAELVRILVERVVGQATRTKDIAEIEEELQDYEYSRLREVQMELLELSFDHQWGQYLYQVREELKHEALTFVKEQRIRCLLQGSWFSKPIPSRDQPGHQHQRETNSIDAKKRLYAPKPWRFARLSHNRRYLHFADFVDKVTPDPNLESLDDKIDLSTISSVVSNVSAGEDSQSVSSGSTLRNNTAQPPGTPKASTTGAAANSTGPKTTTKITIYSYSNPAEAAKGGDTAEQAVLTLHPTSNSLASEWLDGLLMLLNQAPITAETKKLSTLVSDYGMKIRLLNVGVDAVYNGPQPGAGVVPSREGLDDDYYYEI